MTDPLPKKLRNQRKKKAMPTTLTMRGCCGGKLPQWGWMKSSTSLGIHYHHHHHHYHHHHHHHHHLGDAIEVGGALGVDQVVLGVHVDAMFWFAGLHPLNKIFQGQQDIYLV